MRYSILNIYIINAFLNSDKMIAAIFVNFLNFIIILQDFKSFNCDQLSLCIHKLKGMSTKLVFLLMNMIVSLFSYCVKIRWNLKIKKS